MVEKLIFDQSRPGVRGALFPELDIPAKGVESLVPAGLRRTDTPFLPEVSEPEVVRHFTNLSTLNHHVDKDFYPLGSCTMKYNPKINDRLAALPGLALIHPLAPDEEVHRKILWSDKKLHFQYVDLDRVPLSWSMKPKPSNSTTIPGRQTANGLPFAKNEQEMMSRLYLYSLENKTATPVTDGWFSCSGPIFSTDGQYLFFVSDRDFNPIYSQTEWNHIYRDMARIYLLTLRKDIPSPFQPKSDEVQLKAPPAKAEAKEAQRINPRKKNR